MNIKILLAALFFICISCARDSASAEPAATGKINPPGWILGSWRDKANSISYVFSNGEITMNGAGSSVSIKSFIATGGQYSQSSSDASFEFTMGFQGVTTNTYTFRKTGSDTMLLDTHQGSTIEMVRK